MTNRDIIWREFQRHRHECLRLCGHFLNGWKGCEAEDLMMDTILKIARGSYELIDGKLMPLFSVAVRCVLADKKRKAARLTVHPLDALEQTDYVGAIAISCPEIENARFKIMLEELPGDLGLYAECVDAGWMLGEIAAMQGVSRPTVSSRLAVGRKAYAQQIGRVRLRQAHLEECAAEYDKAAILKKIAVNQ